MNLHDLIPQSRIHIGAELETRYEVLSAISRLFAADLGIDQDEVFEALENREEIGPTAIGNGVALPHAKTKLVKSMMGALLTLKEPARTSKGDDAGTDIFLAILIPAEGCDLSPLSRFAKDIKSEAVLDALREAASKEEARAALLLAEGDPD